MIKEKPPKKVKQLKKKLSDPPPLIEDYDASFYHNKHNKFNWVMVIWVVGIIMIGAWLLHWLIMLPKDEAVATAKPDQVEVPLPLPLKELA